MLTIGSKTTPTDPIALFVKDLCLAPFHRQVEVTIISVNAMLHLCPQEDLDRLIIYIDSFCDL